MIKIYKYALELGTTRLELPAGYKILTVQVQNEQPFVWVMVDPDDAIMTTAIIKVFGTGHPLTKPEALVYAGSFQLLGGQFVGHAFEDLSEVVA